MMRKYIILAVLVLNSAVTLAAELTLFEIPLSTASREDIQSAIANAGGKLKSSSRDIDQYDARSIGLPGATQLEVVYLEKKLVMAQYSFRFGKNQEERMRKMLVSKYGQPSGGRGDFDGEYIDDGKYRWAFDNRMDLIYTKEFSGSRFLSYVNVTEEARLGRIIKDADKRAAEKEAASKKSVF
ncbi:hypothetical protein [Rhodocyclus gracilis]|uniref:Uncharacterized protein n=1 Tax=Rhodocyclus tenuis TaxID=1066 RepID=A0A6L5JV98_RHOTE|nr:hypothetical protein [Rhodocyclus gracilis]MQY51303.1 hypothetical protein [Rhodocyclus gracilis]